MADRKPDSPDVAARCAAAWHASAALRTEFGDDAHGLERLIAFETALAAGYVRGRSALSDSGAEN